jgi:hypothetical protein
MKWLRRLFHKSRAASRLDKELRFHLGEQIADLIAAALSPQEARRSARLEFGGLERVKEEVRDTRLGTRSPHVGCCRAAFGCCMATIKKSASYEISGAAEPWSSALR